MKWTRESLGYIKSGDGKYLIEKHYGSGLYLIRDIGAHKYLLAKDGGRLVFGYQKDAKNYVKNLYKENK